DLRPRARAQDSGVRSWFQSTSSGSPSASSSRQERRTSALSSADGGGTTSSTTYCRERTCTSLPGAGRTYSTVRFSPRLIGEVNREMALDLRETCPDSGLAAPKCHKG